MAEQITADFQNALSGAPNYTQIPQIRRPGLPHTFVNDPDNDLSPMSERDLAAAGAALRRRDHKEDRRERGMRRVLLGAPERAFWKSAVICRSRPKFLLIITPLYLGISHEKLTILSTDLTSEKDERNLYCRFILDPGIISCGLKYKHTAVRNEF